MTVHLDEYDFKCTLKSLLVQVKAHVQHLPAELPVLTL